MWVLGDPGTGKTAAVQHVLEGCDVERLRQGTAPVARRRVNKQKSSVVRITLQAFSLRHTKSEDMEPLRELVGRMRDAAELSNDKLRRCRTMRRLLEELDEVCTALTEHPVIFFIDECDILANFTARAKSESMLQFFFLYVLNVKLANTFTIAVSNLTDIPHILDEPTQKSAQISRRRASCRKDVPILSNPTDSFEQLAGSTFPQSHKVVFAHYTVQQLTLIAKNQKKALQANLVAEQRTNLKRKPVISDKGRTKRPSKQEEQESEIDDNIVSESTKTCSESGLEYATEYGIKRIAGTHGDCREVLDFVARLNASENADIDQVRFSSIMYQVA